MTEIEAALPSWREGAAEDAIVGFVARATDPGGPDFVPPADRIAAFDNDGTLRVEQPLPPQFDFVRGRWAQEISAEVAVDRAAELGWTAVSMKDDWSTAFRAGG